MSVWTSIKRSQAAVTAKTEVRVARRRLEATYLARRGGYDFESINSFAMFIGYPRSGHSLVGAIVDAHPNAVISHELDALALLERGFSRAQLFALITRSSEEFSEKGGAANDGLYNYGVPNQWQGRYDTLRVIGDKTGGRSSRRLRYKPELLDRLAEAAGVPLQFLHVIRNPYDNIATIFRRGSIRPTLPASAAWYFELCETNEAIRQRYPGAVRDIRTEEFIRSTDVKLREICEFVGLPVTDEYIEDCASIVFDSPRQSRHEVDWTPDLLKFIADRSAQFDFLRDYSFES